MKSLLKSLGLCLFSLYCLAQNVTITPNGITPSNAASIPTLTYDAIEALPSPAFGTMANDVTFKCLRYYNGAKWVRLLSDRDINMPTIMAWGGGGTMQDNSYDIAIDTNGNIYITGSFQGTATFGPTTLTSVGNNDIYIAKYTRGGTLLWVKSAGSPLSDVGVTIATDDNGNAYVSGTFNGTATFGNISLTSIGSKDIFIVKYSSNGEVIWAKQAGSTADDDVRDMMVDNSNNIYITGGFADTAFFGNTSAVSAGLKDIFIAKYADNGVFQWVQRTGGVSQEYATGIAMDTNGYICLVGSIFGISNFGNITIGVNGNGYDVFIAKYNPLNSTWVWAKRAGGTGMDYGNAIAVDAEGNVLFTGEFEKTAEFSNYNITSAGESDVFVAKYGNDGSRKWVRRAGGDYYDYGNSIGVDAKGNVYLTGSFYGRADFEGKELVGVGIGDVFYAKYRPDGVLSWVQNSGGASGDIGTSMVVEPNGNVFITGYINADALFGEVYLTNAGSSDIFIARIKD